MRRRGTADLGLESLLRVVEDSELDADPEVQRLVQAAATTENRVLRQRVKQLLALKISRHSVHPFDFEDRDVAIPMQRRIFLGEDSSGSRFSLLEDSFSKHLLSVGQSGSGKTTLFYNVMRQLSVPFWSFDLKQDYRHLTTEVDGLVVVPWTELKFNPLKPPPGVPPRRWAQVFSEMFSHATALLSGSKNYLLKQIFELFQLYGLFTELSGPYPSLHELQLLVRENRMNYVRTASDYRDRLLNRLEAMNLTAGTVFDCSQGYPIEELLQRNVVFEFDGLSRDVQNFLMEILFAYVYEYRLAQNQRDQGLNHVFFLDEGKRVFSVYKERQEASGIPEIDELTAKMREFGEGLAVADQEASKLTDSIKANTYTKVLLSTGDRKQFQAVAESMNLSEKQMEFAQGLDVGEAVIQSGNGDPTPVNLNEYRIEKQVSGAELEKRMAEDWKRFSHEPRETPRQFDQIMQGKQEAFEEQEIPDDPTPTVDVSEKADRLLKDIAENPFKPLSERYERFSSSYMGNKAKNELVNQGVLIERQVRTQEGKRKLLDFTDRGREYVENDLDLEVNQQGRGSGVHRYWQHRIKEAFETAGWAAELEMFDADVYVNLHDSELVIEVAMGNNQREIDHIEKHLDTGFDSIWVVCRNQEILEDLKQRMQENGLIEDRVAFRLFRDFNNQENFPG
jgi:hypothetical protein